LQSGGISKEQYFMICEQMGVEPIPEEIPIDFEDLEYECQLAVKVFNILPDRIEGMGGSWLGKDFSGLGTFLEIYEIDDRKQFIELITILINETSTHYSREQKARAQKNKSKGRK